MRAGLGGARLAMATTIVLAMGGPGSPEGAPLALSHARSGCASMLSGYMGRSDVLDKAIAKFSMAYADQNEKDHAALERAVRSGKVKAVFEEAK